MLYYGYPEWFAINYSCDSLTAERLVMKPYIATESINIVVMASYHLE